MNLKNTIPDAQNYGIIIPCYNVGTHLSPLLKAIMAYIPAEQIYVVDDGSTDQAMAAAQKAGVHILTHPKNLGKGAALQTGFQAVTHSALPFVITIDGDEQHAAESIPDFISIQQNKNSDIVLGCRSLSLKKMPWDRIVSNHISSLIISWVCGQRIPDSQCGYRLFRTGIFSSISLSTRHYETETEILFKTLNQGWKIDFCPIPTLYNSKISYINRFVDSLRFMLLLLRKLFNRI